MITLHEQRPCQRSPVVLTHVACLTLAGVLLRDRNNQRLAATAADYRELAPSAYRRWLSAAGPLVFDGPDGPSLVAAIAGTWLARGDVMPRRSWSHARTLRSPGLCLLLLVGCMPNLDELNSGAETGSGETGSQQTGQAGRPSGGSAGAVGAVDSAGATSGSASGGSAGASAPSGGAGGAGAPACVAKGEETCNAVDDDCNGVIDDGCPSALKTVFDGNLEELGDSPGGDPFADDCPAGHVLTGVHIGLAGWLGQTQGICRELALELDEAAQAGFRITMKPGKELASHPETTTITKTTLSCPEAEAVVGLRVSQQAITSGDVRKVVIPKVWMQCATLILLEVDGAYSVSWEGLRELAPVAGSDANDSAWFLASAAPLGSMATRLIGSSGDWIDRIGIGVGKVVVIVNPSARVAPRE